MLIGVQWRHSCLHIRQRLWVPRGGMKKGCAPLPVHIPFRGKSYLLGCSLQLAASADLDTVAGSDLDGLAGGGVASCTCSTVGALDREPSGDGDLRALAHLGGQGVEERIKHSVNSGLALARRCGDCRDKLGTVHSKSSSDI